MTLTLSLEELAAVVFAAVFLATTDPAGLSRLLVAWLSKRLGVRPDEIRATDRATDGDDPEGDP